MKTREALSEQIGELTLALQRSQEQCKNLERRYVNAVLDIGEIARAVDRVRQGLPQEPLDEAADVLNRPDDPEILREAKKRIAVAVGHQAAAIRRMKARNPKATMPDAKRFVLDTAYDHYQREKGKPPGRRNLKIKVDDVLDTTGRDLVIGDRVCGAYLKQRKGKKK
jgi:hypothetical protein